MATASRLRPLALVLLRQQLFQSVDVSGALERTELRFRVFCTRVGVGCKLVFTERLELSRGLTEVAAGGGGGRAFGCERHEGERAFHTRAGLQSAAVRGEGRRPGVVAHLRMRTSFGIAPGDRDAGGLVEKARLGKEGGGLCVVTLRFRGPGPLFFFSQTEKTHRIP